ncbi:perlucin-like isoform X2 [Mizuhopecten yessoensis]|uniref:perlucin-like isoform X2 n=1 Tax=Mizuhopecten yessoensis TaxID=6573 RepID=UPI000B4573D1|nr:perlucin-like isoform X2 [Mizuhopecten yessoensis]
MAYLVRPVLICIALAVQVIRGCPNGWETFDGSCYFIFDIKEPWLAASTTCNSYHAHLADVKDVHEDNFLKQIINKYHYGHPSDTYFWLGGNDMFVEGDWVWKGSGHRFRYTHWLKGEPNNNNGQDCLLSHISGTRFYWEDRECTSKYNFVCEVSGSGAAVIG